MVERVPRVGDERASILHAGDTFEDFLMRAESNGMIDFHLRIVRSPEGLLDFYIHPQDRDGETGDFHVGGGFVTRVSGGLAAGSSRRVIRLVGSKPLPAPPKGG